MPIYEYECKKCHHRFERIQKFSDPHVKSCPNCAGKVEMIVSAPAVQFKGSGWYVTDYVKKSPSTASSNGGSSDKLEKKPDTKNKLESKKAEKK